MSNPIYNVKVSNIILEHMDSRNPNFKRNRVITYGLLSEILNKNLCGNTVDIVYKLCNRMEIFFNRTNKENYTRIFHNEKFEELEDLNKQETEILMIMILVFGFSNICLLWIASDYNQNKKEKISRYHPDAIKSLKYNINRYFNKL